MEMKKYTEYKYDGIKLSLSEDNGEFGISVCGHPIVTSAHAAVRLKNSGRQINTNDFLIHEIETNGNTVTVRHSREKSGLDIMAVQTFVLSENSLLTKLEIIGDDISTNYIVPLETSSRDGLLNTGSECDSFLSIPFDNDSWAEPHLYDMKAPAEVKSYEAAAVLDTKTNEGIVIGSVEHDKWKTGITCRFSVSHIDHIKVFGGAADEMTRDNSPHGYVSGRAVASPAIFIGWFSDWRDGMTAFAKANTVVAPKKISPIDSVPIGFNSWAVMASDVTYSELIGVSDYVKKKLQDTWQSDGSPVYINIDSFWDAIVLNDPAIRDSIALQDALISFVDHCHKNGQKAGIYYTPFACWHGSIEDMKKSRIYDTGYTYYDIVLRSTDSSRFYGTLDGGYPLDPTHPGTRRAIYEQFRRFMDMGFEYIKLDFMGHGALEGSFFDPEITTGMEAYNSGMKYIRDLIGDRMFINLSIAPIFPYQYADGRRISCDAWARPEDLSHVLSYTTYCFFEKELYSYPDPDHLVVWGQYADVPYGNARSRVTTGVISGTSFLVGDNLARPAGDPDLADRRFTEMLANPRIIDAAKLGHFYRPLHVSGGKKHTDVFYTEEADSTYLAVFNITENERTIEVSMSDVGLCTTARGLELWTNRSVLPDANGILKLKIEPNDCMLIKFNK